MVSWVLTKVPRQLSGKEIISAVVLEQLDSHMQSMKLDPFLTSYTKIDSK